MTTFFPDFIILGTMRSGTTSVFRSLADHPQVCVGPRKELNVFADQFSAGDVAVASEYKRMFSACPPSQVRIEASPSYAELADELFPFIARVAPDIKVALLLREPVQRAVSVYKAIVRSGAIYPNVSPSKFVDSLLSPDPDLSIFPNADFGQGIWRELFVVGRYSQLVERAAVSFSMDSIYIGFLDDLAESPRRELQRICEFLGISPHFYSSYKFSVENPTIQARWPMLYRVALMVNASLEPLLMHAPRVRRTVRRFHNALNSDPAHQFEIPERTLRQLKDFYLGDHNQLLESLQLLVPYKRLPAWLKSNE